MDDTAPVDQSAALVRIGSAIAIGTVLPPDTTRQPPTVGLMLVDDQGHRYVMPAGAQQNVRGNAVFRAEFVAPEDPSEEDDPFDGPPRLEPHGGMVPVERWEAAQTCPECKHPWTRHGKAGCLSCYPHNCMKQPPIADARNIIGFVFGTVDKTFYGGKFAEPIPIRPGHKLVVGIEVGQVPLDPRVQLPSQQMRYLLSRCVE